MSPQLFLLHARARQLPMLVLGVALTALLTKAVGDYLVHQAWPDDRFARLPVVAGAPLAVATLLAPTLAGADPDLESSTPQRWRWQRLAHVLLATVLSGFALVMAGLNRPWQLGAVELARNTLGCVGLVALGACVLGARFAWAPAVGYLGLAYMGAPPPSQATALDHLWAWPMYPSGEIVCTVAALALWGLGLMLYATKKLHAR